MKNEEVLEFDDDLENDEDDDETSSNLQSRAIITTSSDPEIDSLYGKCQRGKLILQPEFQRQFVWDRKRASRLIESALLSVPIPIIYLAEDNDGTEYVIDGQQRLTSFFAFLSNQFPLNSKEPFKLTGLEAFKELNKKTYKDLDEKLQDKIRYYTVKTITIRKESDPILKFEIFERLNRGSVALNDMELRNCVYRGSYIDLIKDLASTPDFLKLLGLSEPHPRMQDLELVLRFASFYHSTYLKYKSPMKSFFNNDMEVFREINDKDKESLKKVFKNSVSIIYSLFGEAAFKRYNSGNDKNPNGSWEKKKFNAALYDVMMNTFAEQDKNKVFQSLDSLKEGIIDLMSSNLEFQQSILIGTSAKSSVTKRFDLFRTTVERILEDYKPQERCFSFALKKKLYEENAICSICKQKIIDIDDAAIDHIHQYWKGGQTIPENARLTHRYCNLARSRKE